MNIKPKFKLKPSRILSTCCTGGNICKCEYCYFHCPESAKAAQYMEYCSALKAELPTIDEMEAQSATEKNLEVVEQDTTNEKEVNLEFSDPVKQYSLIVGRKLEDKTYMVSEVGKEDDLSTFMGRPIRIFTKTWEVNESPDYVNVINPWDLFLSDTKVVNKIETFKLLQGTLNLKILVNGSPFHYGRMFIGCRPTAYDNNTQNNGPVTSLNTLNYYNENTPGTKSVNALATLYSQRPHVYVDPSTNQPQHIEWPFFVTGNYIDLTDQKTINRMGRLEIWELTKLKHANGATDPVEISIFAWMTNVSFAGLTAQAPATAQSGLEKRPKKSKGKKKAPKFDGSESSGAGEYKKDGLISGPASTIKAVADYFTEIPYIGPFAKATSIASGAVSSIAKLFGFSRPPILSDTVFVRPQNIGNMANTHGADPIQKLSLDPKQELTIDPGTVGLTPDDQMSFGYLLKRESFIDNFAWNTLTTQNTGLLYSIIVHPKVYPRGSASPIVRYPSAVGFVAEPFAYWSGSLRYRFQIVASQFHRGRLLFVYEPSPGTAGTVADTNDRFAHIVDISEERDVTFEINWTQESAYRSLGLGDDSEYHTVEGPTGAMVAADFAESANGRLNVFVVNQLAAPTDAANVEVNVFISGGDSLEYKLPNTVANRTFARDDVDVGPPALAQSLFVAQSKQESSGATITQQENAPEHDTMYVLNGNPTSMMSEQSDVYFGEAIVSVRSLLKRYCFHRALATPENETGAIYNNLWKMKNFPNGPGPSYGSSLASPLTEIGVGGTNYNICAMTYLRWFNSAYIGYRGGIRWKVTFFNEDMDIMSVRVVRHDPSTFESVSGTLVFGGATSVSTVSQNFLEETTYSRSQTGLMATAANVNPTLEFEIPFYHNYRFAECNCPADPTYLPGANSPGDAAPFLSDSTHGLSYTSKHENANNFSWIETHCAIGEDFSFFFFIGAPPFMDSDATSVTPT
jgi:hypothetical protein